MYATSQRVSSGQGITGINTFLHEHNGETGTDIDWDQVSAEQITEHLPGQPVMSHTEVPPGRNHVLSYLDVICPDATPVPEIEAAINRTRATLQAGPPPVERSLGTVTVRFGATLGLEGASEIEYEALAERVLRILREHSTEE